MTSTERSESVDSRWLALFEDRYGAGAYQRLLADLRQPCLTFAAIARGFGVTRERVRQWQQVVLPDAPRGHARKRLCAAYRQKRRLLEDPVFRRFFQHARASWDGDRIAPILARDRYRTRVVRIDERIVTLHIARLLPAGRSIPGRPTYLLPSCGSGDFAYYQLPSGDFLVVPRKELPPTSTRFVDGYGSRYSAYKNTFEALRANGLVDGNVQSA